MSSSRLVSIVIPAYKPDFFEAALASALRQNHDEIEIVVSDDCRTDAIERIVEKLSPKSRWPIRYFHNPVPLGEAHNIAHGIRQARGEYIKFLYDDDLLVPDCTRLLFEAMHGKPDITLAAGRRKRIDRNGDILMDTLATLNPFTKDVVINGPDLVSFQAQKALNFIGEPCAVMCRRKDVLSFGDEIMSFKQKLIVGLGDLALYLKLLRQGNLALLARPLSYFRVWELQTSEVLRVNPSSAIEGHTHFYRITRELGWLRPPEINDLVRVAPLTQRNTVQTMDLRTWFELRSLAEPNNSEINGWLNKRKPSPIQQTLISQHLHAHDGGPAIAIVVSDFNNQPESVLNTLLNLASYTSVLDKIKVFILADYDRDNLTPLQEQLPWLASTEHNRATVINQLLQENEQSWWMLVDAGSTFTANGLLQAVMGLIDRPQASALFGDEVQQDAKNLTHVVMRPDFNLDYLLANPSALSKHWLFNRSAILAAGGFKPQYAKALEFDLILRLIEHPDFTGFTHCCEPLVISAASQPQDNPDQANSLLRHLSARGYLNSTLSSSVPGQYQIDYGHVEQPLVSILINCEDQLQTLLPCVESLLETTLWPHYEILIVDNASQDASTVHWLDSMQALQSYKIRILHSEHKQSKSALINAAACHANGEYLLLLSNTTRINQGDWLHKLLNHGLRKEVGITGAKLVDIDGQVVQGGLVLGPEGSFIPVTGKVAAQSDSFKDRLDTEQNYSAVSGDCLLIRKSLFDELQGLDEQRFTQHFNDIDLCLRVRDSGHTVVWTPHATLTNCAASTQPDPQALEVATRTLYYRWLHYLAWDPAYNKTLTLQGKPLERQNNHELGWRPLIHRPLPVVLVQPADRGRTGNRIADPLRALRTAGCLDGVVAYPELTLPELARISPDVVVLQGTASTADAQRIGVIKDHTYAQVVYDLVAFSALAESDPHSLAKVKATLRSNLARADRIVVPTQELADLLKDLHPDVQRIETRLAPETWLNQQDQSASRSKLRVGYCASAEQPAELQLLAQAIRSLADQVDWVIMGPCSRWLLPFIHQLHSVADDTLQPGLLAELNLDLALVPAETSPFDPGKTTALLEFGARGVPVICSDTIDSKDLPVTRVTNTPLAWKTAIEDCLKHTEARQRQGYALQNAVIEHWMLDAEKLQTWNRVIGGLTAPL